MTGRRPANIESKCILASTNKSVERLNSKIIEAFPGPSRFYHSVDSVDMNDPSDAKMIFPDEFLHSIDVNGVPPHIPHLKKGCVVMHSRNLNVSEGLCNGTRMIVEDMRNNCILARIIPSGKTVCIPRVPIVTNTSHLPAPFRRVQFPIKLAFSMTINKSQGQTFEYDQLAQLCKFPVNITDHSNDHHRDTACHALHAGSSGEIDRDPSVV